MIKMAKFENPRYKTCQDLTQGKVDINFIKFNAKNYKYNII